MWFVDADRGKREGLALVKTLAAGTEIGEDPETAATYGTFESDGDARAAYDDGGEEDSGNSFR
jgi:hypothetical protein